MTDRGRPQYLTRLAEFASREPFAALGDDVVERVRWIIADCLPVIGAGMQTPELKALVAAQLAAASPGPATIIGAGRKANAFDAALLNGTAGTALELDEGNLFAKGHPGIQVVPAAVAAAEELYSTGENLLAAVAMGYEISSRIHRAASVKLAVHPHGTYGVIGAAVAVGRLKGFSPAQMCELINIAATMGMATSRQSLLDGATVRNIYTGHSGYMGSMAVRLLECGFTGEIDAVASVYGKVLSDAFDPDLAVKDLGSEWIVTKSYFKLHPAGRYVHSAIDALYDLQARVPGGRLDPQKISRLEVRAYSLAAMLAEKTVTTSFGARFSVPFALASIITLGRSGLVAFSDAAVANPVIQALAGRVDISEDEAFTARYPDEQPVTVRVVMQDGTVYEGRCVLTKGEPSNPHTPGELREKFFDLARPVWGDKRSEALFDGLMRLQAIPDVAAWLEGVFG
jgi:2-methylcitrate dehydratase PrpD